MVFSDRQAVKERSHWSKKKKAKAGKQISKQTEKKPAGVSRHRDRRAHSRQTEAGKHTANGRFERLFLL